MKKQVYLLSVKALLLSLIVSACSPTNPRLQTPPEENNVVTVSDSIGVYEVNSKVDILFVIDNSVSMDRHQSNLSRNIESFVEEFEKNKILDYHIAVTTISDQVSAQKRLEDPKWAGFTPPLVGELVPLKIKNTEGKLEASQGSRYISRNTENKIEVLKNTLIVGTVKLEDGGPQYEEVFPPVKAAIGPGAPVNNEGFYRPEANLVVIVITDADDASDITAEGLYNDLLRLKDGERKKIQVYAAVIPSSAPATCKRDYSNQKPAKIETLTQMFQNQSKKIVNLCSQNFGQELANIGIDLSQNIQTQTIQLPFIPEFKSKNDIKVYYGKQELKNDPKTGWMLDKSTLILGRNLDVEFETDAKIFVKATPVRIENYNNGRAKPAF